MNKGILLVATVLWAGGAVGTVKYKCDGKWVDYWPCDSKSTDVTIYASQHTKAKRPLVFEGPPSERLALVATELEAVQKVAYGCDWELNNVQGGIDDCKTLLTILKPNSRHHKASEEYIRLEGDKEFLKKNSAEFNRLYQIQGRILDVVNRFTRVINNE